VNFATRKEYWSIREEIYTVETYSESARGCGVEALVTGGDLADGHEVSLFAFPDLAAEAKPRVVTNEERRLEERSIICAIARHFFPIPLVQSHNQLGSPGVVGVLDEFLNHRATERKPSSTSHLLQERTDGAGYVVPLATRPADCWG
jgi:hypothetical protein